MPESDLYSSPLHHAISLGKSKFKTMHFEQHRLRLNFMSKVMPMPEHDDLVTPIESRFQRHKFQEYLLVNSRRLTSPSCKTLKHQGNLPYTILPWDPTTFIFRGYNPYFEGLRPSFFHRFWGPRVCGNTN